MEELMDEFPEELMAILSLSLDYLLQDNPLSFSGYTPEELESFLDNLKDSINELVFKRVGPSGREETELSFGTDRTFATGLKVPGEEGKLVEGNPAEASKDINEVLLPEELVPGENKAGAEMEDGAQPIVSEREETEGPVPTSIYLAEARLEEAAGDEKLSLAKGNSPVEESSIEDMRKGNTTAGIAATAEGNNEVITADMKAGQEELTTEPKFFRIENQNYNHNHNLDTEDKAGQKKLTKNRSFSALKIKIIIIITILILKISQDKTTVTMKASLLTSWTDLPGSSIWQGLAAENCHRQHR